MKIKIKGSFIKPCLIYEHLVEALCSASEALKDSDDYLFE